MSNDADKLAAAELAKLDREIAPPVELEDRVVGELSRRGLIGDGHPEERLGWRSMRAALAAAAAVAVLALGVLIGRVTQEPGAVPGTLTGAENDLYALLLYETPGYDAPSAAEARSRYSEYSRWVGEAYQRDQFVTGEDLEVGEGWLIKPTPNGPVVESASAVAAGAPLSGIFFIRADSAEHALELARALPHLRHGGQVVVQKTIPTVEAPP